MARATGCSTTSRTTWSSAATCWSIVMYQYIGSGEFAAALAIAAGVEDYGRRFDDPDLLAMGLFARAGC